MYFFLFIFRRIYYSRTLKSTKRRHWYGRTALSRTLQCIFCMVFHSLYVCCFCTCKKSSSFHLTELKRMSEAEFHTKMNVLDIESICFCVGFLQFNKPHTKHTKPSQKRRKGFAWTCSDNDLFLWCSSIRKWFFSDGRQEKRMNRINGETGANDLLTIARWNCHRWCECGFAINRRASVCHLRSRRNMLNW